MKRSCIKRMMALVLAGAMLFNMAAVSVFAEEAEGDASGKYVSDVFIAYGKTEKEAKKWLTDNGWEPVEGDFNAGKASFFDNNKIQDQNVAAVMGIKRTDDKHNAITDMAVMNMTGGYSIPDYETLLTQKKAEIDEFVNHFMVVIEEYRANYNNEGSEFGQKRAKLANDLLNKFYDGDPEDAYAVNDTGEKLGDLFLAQTRQEGNEQGADLQQIILESSGPAVLAVEALLAMGTDTGEETWIERASGLTGEDLAENLVKYVPEAAGQDVADSAVSQFLNQKFGDTADVLSNQWHDIHDEMIWYEAYNEENGLWQDDGEDEEAYNARVEQYFADMKETDEEKYDADCQRYYTVAILYNRLYEVAYIGDWGETMGDFFNPADGAEYVEPDYFLPMAAALSDGQRAGLDFLSLQTFLIIGLGSEEGLDYVAPDLKDILGDEKQVMDVYTGVNRGAFRSGVALTSEALMEQNAGKGQAYDRIWDNTGIVAITSYAAGALGAITLATGAFFSIKKVLFASPPGIIKNCVGKAEFAYYRVDAWNANRQVGQLAADNPWMASFRQAEKDLAKARGYNVTTAGRWMMGIGGALMIAAAIVKGVQLWKYYDRDMTPIPRMIVDESDIVTYLTDDSGKPLLDENGNQKKNIDFNTYEYYDSVKCNRPDVGEIGDWQDGVKEYQDPDHYCYDVADLNADMGQEWIALYTVKSKNKGDPVLADSLTLSYGKQNGKPKGCTQALHLFTYTNVVDLGDTAWAFNNDKKGVYFYWDVDEGAFAAETASGFSGGSLALAGIGGLILGIAGSTAVWLPKRRKEEREAA